MALTSSDIMIRPQAHRLALVGTHKDLSPPLRREALKQFGQTPAWEVNPQKLKTLSQAMTRQGADAKTKPYPATLLYGVPYGNHTVYSPLTGSRVPIKVDEPTSQMADEHMVNQIAEGFPQPMTRSRLLKKSHYRWDGVVDAHNPHTDYKSFQSITHYPVGRDTQPVLGVAIQTPWRGNTSKQVVPDSHGNAFEYDYVTTFSRLPHRPVTLFLQDLPSRNQYTTLHWAYRGDVTPRTFQTTLFEYPVGTTPIYTQQDFLTP